MRITDSYSKTSIVGLGAAGASALGAIVRRWRVAWWGVGKIVAGVRGVRLRADIQRLIGAFVTRRAPEPASVVEERSAALAALCEMLLVQLDDERAGAAEIRFVVHGRGELSGEPGRGRWPDSGSAVDAEDEELVWELRRLLAASGGMIADVAHALERRGEDVDRNGRELLGDEVGAVEVDIAILKTLLSGPVDWDGECRRLLAGEVPPFEDRVVDDDEQDEDD